MKISREGFLLMLLLFLVGRLSVAQTLSVKHYEEDNSNIPNPERGFYHHTETQSGAYSLLEESTLKAYRSQGITMLLRMFYIDDYVSQPIDQDYLTNMQTDFNTARAAGIKMIVRFAYTQKSSAPYNDASPEWVLKHIAQLKPLLTKNSDVIAVVQAGFVGAWGEWYYTDHFSQTLGNPTAADWVNRRAVVRALLDALPEGRSVLVRTPAIKFSIVESTEALTSEQAFSNLMKARIGHHNDCFLASDTDYGTYTDDMDAEKAFLEQETNYVAMGGETCGQDVPLSECPNALEQMKRFHWSFLNRDYHGDVLNSWEEGSCMPEVVNKLGYRFRLVESSLQTDTKPGGEVKLSLKLINDGWANPYNKRLVEILLRKQSDGKLSRLVLNEDPRRWTRNDTIRIDVTAGVPLDISEGEYEVLLNLPDPEPTLRGNPDFSIRLANPDTWEKETGFNKLASTLLIDDDAAVSSYDGADLFLSSPSVLLAAPVKVKASSSGQKVILYWGNDPDSPYYRVIERSEDGETFSRRGVLSPDDFVFVDQVDASSASVQYRTYLVNDAIETVSLTSDVTSVSVSTRPLYYVFKTDAEISEWENVQPLATTLFQGETQAYRAFVDIEKLNVLFEGEIPSQYSIYFDTDNSIETGSISNEWNYHGFDFLVRNDSLYSASGSDLDFVEKVSRSSSDNVLELSIPLSSLHITDATTIETAANVTVDDEVVLSYPTIDRSPVELQRQIPAPTPAGLTVNNSENFPETQLVIQWTPCSGCEGYVLERSLDSNNFSIVATTGKFDHVFRDNDLSKDVTYYYRIYSYNDAGLSAPSAIENGKPAQVVSVEQTFQKEFSGYPNPVEQSFTFTRSDINARSFLHISNSTGGSVNVLPMEKNQSSIVIDFSTLPRGLYLLHLSGSTHTLKVFRK